MNSNLSNWGTELVNGIASWIEYQRTISFTRIPEGAVQLIVEGILQSNSGRNERIYKVENNYPVKLDNDKFADIAFWLSKEEENPCGLIEKKVVTSAAGKKKRSKKKAIIEDVIKLARFSKQDNNAKCYLLLVGEYDGIAKIIVVAKIEKNGIYHLLKYDGDIEQKINGWRSKKQIIIDDGIKEIKNLDLTVFENGDKISAKLSKKSVAGLRVQDNEGKQKYRTCALLWEVTYTASKFNSKEKI
ncbi:MAG: hypothetical protein RAO94_02340 [Candidatus Stygibacter australis]|nr:hypothetical protein [Candidatus Stygibacter australis]MDP8321171.1 hypothetical protein [Candidatus Stygibacter australis]